MNIRNVCLAILFDGDASGYEIRKKSTEGEFSYFVEASFGSIYPALARLEEEGLVTATVEQQDGRPAKKVYSITQTGRNAFLESLYDDPGEDVFRSPFLLFARYAEHLPAGLVGHRVKERIAMLADHIRELQDMREKFDRPADRWVIDFGLTMQKVAEDYLRTHMSDLVGLARQDETRDAAE